MMNFKNGISSKHNPGAVIAQRRASRRANQFAALCGEFLIDPALALENENLCAALRDRKPESEIRRLLETEF